MIHFLLLSAALACSQTAVPEELRDAVADFQSKYAPARVDKAPIDKLFGRLSRDGQYQKTEGEKTIAVALYEVPVPQADGYSDALYRRAFSHMTAEEQTKKGSQLDVWQYDLGLDGTLAAVRHITLKLDDKGEILERGARFRRLSPSDAAAQNRWKRLAPKLLELGKTREA